MFKEKETLEELKVINKKLDTLILLSRSKRLKEMAYKSKGGNE